MTYVLLTAATVEPLSLDDVKAHLRIDAAGEEALLTGLIRVAREHLERTTGLVLIRQDWRLSLDRWPVSGIVEIARFPVSAIGAVRSYDRDGLAQPVSLAGHVLDGAARPARLVLPALPAELKAVNGIEIDFTAGFGATAADVPDGLRRAMLIHAAQMFEFRGAVPLDMQPAAIPAGYDRLLAPYLVRRL